MAFFGDTRFGARASASTITNDFSATAHSFSFGAPVSNCTGKLKKHRLSQKGVQETGKLSTVQSPSWKAIWTIDSMPEGEGFSGIMSPEFSRENERWYLRLLTTCPGEEIQNSSTIYSSYKIESEGISAKIFPGDIILAISAEHEEPTGQGHHYKLDVRLPDQTLLKSFRCRTHSGDGKSKSSYFVLPSEIAQRIRFSMDRCAMICEFSLEAGEEPTREVSSQIELTSADTDKLAGDLKGLLLNGDASDATIRAKGQDFHVHRAILGARTPVFRAMFRKHTKESSSGVVEMEDCEPDTFQRFLQYVYTGNVEGMTPDNAASLYEVADKYQVEPLKEKCLKCIKGGLSVETFCQAVALAMKHDERELTALATDFFANNFKDIIPNDEWSRFLHENPTEANEILVKALCTK